MAQDGIAMSIIAENSSDFRQHTTLLIKLVALDPSRLTAAVTCQSSIIPETISDTVDFKISSRDLREAYDTVRSVTQRSPSRRGSTALLDPVKDVGTRLFNALFQNQLGRAYRESVLLADERS